jgi:chaperonin GroEL
MLPHVTKDGVSVAQEFALKDPLENMGSHMIQEAAKKSAYFAGDGTTTATALAYAIVRNVFKNIRDKKFLAITIYSNKKDVNLVEVKKGIDRATEDVVALLKQLSTQATPDMVRHVATISANGDKVIGQVVGDAVNKVGVKGAITIEESKDNITRVKFSEGYQLDSGWFDVVFVNRPDHMACELQDARVLIVDETLSRLKDIEPFLNKYGKTPGALIIVANGFQGEVLASMIESRKQLQSPLCLIKAPSMGTYRQDFLKDLALFTGAKVFGDEHTYRIKSFQMEHLGTCSQVIINQNKSTFIGGAGDQDRIEDEIKKIQSLMTEATESNGKHLDNRFAALQSLVANIEVASNSNIELREIMDRLDDSIKAAKAALDEGVIIGGGSALIKAQGELHEQRNTYSFKLGYNALADALSEPLTQICENGGMSRIEIDRVIDWIMNSANNQGYDAVNELITDMFQAGIVDPLKVARIALESAASVAGAIVTTECVLAFEGTPDPSNEPR